MNLRFAYSLGWVDGLRNSTVKGLAGPSEKLRRVKPLKAIFVTQRGESKPPKAPARDSDWSSGLDVLNIVRGA
jgi:hypothetical protein